MDFIRLCVCSGLMIVTLALSSCASKIYSVPGSTPGDGRYDSEFPNRGCSKQLEEISRTIKAVNCIATYKVYILPSGSALKKDDITEDVLEAQAERVQYANNTSSGTVTVMYNVGFRVAGITCAHIVNNPDTTYTYFVDRSGRRTEFVQSVGLLQSQVNYVADFPDGGEMEILALDKANDIAVLGKSFFRHPEASIEAFEYPTGKAKDLEWGSFVYLFGFPLGNKMVSRAIVSSPNRDQKGSFLLDAVFNRGFSGGIILAVRDGVPNFELVGMVSSVPADYDYVITPPRDNPGVEFDTSVPYNGEIYIDKKMSIKYGVTRAISIETIRDFIFTNRNKFESKGYYLTDFFERDTPPGDSIPPPAAAPDGN